MHQKQTGLWFSPHVQSCSLGLGPQEELWSSVPAWRRGSGYRANDHKKGGLQWEIKTTSFHWGSASTAREGLSDRAPHRRRKVGLKPPFCEVMQRFCWFYLSEAWDRDSPQGDHSGGHGGLRYAVHPSQSKISYMKHENNNDSVHFTD